MKQIKHRKNKDNRNLASKFNRQMAGKMAQVARDVISDDTAQVFQAEVMARNVDGTVQIRRPEETLARGAPSPVIGHRTPSVGDWVWCLDLGPAGVLVVSFAHASIQAAPLRTTGDQAMTGPLTLHGDPTNALHPATKRYVDSVDTQTMTLKNGWGAVNPVKVSLFPNKMVLVSGRIKNTSGAQKAVNSNPWDMPADRIPAQGGRYACSRSDASGSFLNEQSTPVQVGNDGTMGCLVAIGAGWEIDVSTISYLAA